MSTSTFSDRLFVRVRMDSTIPKLLVKVAPEDAVRHGVKNLGEVVLRKALCPPSSSSSSSLSGGGGSGKERIAVVNISNTVSGGEVLMSVKLAEMLELDEEASVEVVPAGAAAASGAAS